MKNSKFNSILDQTYRKEIRKCCDVISGKGLLSRKRLSACFRISEEGKPVNEFNPDAPRFTCDTRIKFVDLDLQSISIRKGKRRMTAILQI